MSPTYKDNSREKFHIRITTRYFEAIFILVLILPLSKNHSRIILRRNVNHDPQFFSQQICQLIPISCLKSLKSNKLKIYNIHHTNDPINFFIKSNQFLKFQLGFRKVIHSSIPKFSANYINFHTNSLERNLKLSFSRSLLNHFHKISPKFYAFNPLIPNFYNLLSLDEIEDNQESEPEFYIDYKNDISYEGKYIPKNFTAPRPNKLSPVITTLSLSGWSKPNIDTFDSNRYKLFSYNTPNEIKRNKFWDYLVFVSNYRNYYYLKKYDSQIKRFQYVSPEEINELEEFRKLLTLKRQGQISHVKNTLPDHDLFLNEDAEYNAKNSTNDEDYTSDMNKNSDNTTNRVESKSSSLDDNIETNEKTEKILLQELLKNFETDKFDQFLQKIMDFPVTSPTPQLYFYRNNHYNCMFKTYKFVGKEALPNIPTPNRRLESFRYQVNGMKNFYRTKYDSNFGEYELSARNLIESGLIDMSTKYYSTIIFRNGIFDKDLSLIVNALQLGSDVLKHSDLVEYLMDLYKNDQTAIQNKANIADDDNSVNNDNDLIFTSWFNLDSKSKYLLDSDMRFIPEYTNYHLRNTQPFHRGQIGIQSRKYDNDFPIFDYRKNDFGMAKFSSLNLFGINDVCCVVIPENFRSELPIRILFLYTSSSDLNQASKNEIRDKAKSENTEGQISKPLCNPRLIVYVKKNANATIYHSQNSCNNNQFGCINSSVRVNMEANSTLRHLYSQEVGSNIFHVENISVKVSNGSNHNLKTVSLGSQFSRINLQIDAKKDSSHINRGLSLVNGTQEMLKYEMFHHTVENTTTNQIHKYIIANNGFGLWRGKVRIEQDGIKADADTLCNVLLLNLGSKCITVPTLEIIPSDIIKASHGATISDIDQESLYYLMSRGLSELDSRQLLMEAFALEVYDEFPDKFLKKRIEDKLRIMSPKSDSISEKKRMYYLSRKKLLENKIQQEE